MPDQVNREIIAKISYMCKIHNRRGVLTLAVLCNTVRTEKPLGIWPGNNSNGAMDTHVQVEWPLPYKAWPIPSSCFWNWLAKYILLYTTGSTCVWALESFDVVSMTSTYTCNNYICTCKSMFNEECTLGMIIKTTKAYNMYSFRQGETDS